MSRWPFALAAPLVALAIAAACGRNLGDDVEADPPDGGATDGAADTSASGDGDGDGAVGCGSRRDAGVRCDNGTLCQVRRAA